MRDKRLSDPGTGQGPIDHEELARIEREFRLHRERYLEVMLQMWSDSDQETRARLEEMYTAATGGDLAKIAKDRTAKETRTDVRALGGQLNRALEL